IEQDPDLRGKYKFIETIGTGGTAVVYRARQTAINKLVAIKMLHSYTVSDRAIQRLQLEGKAACLLEKEHIVKVLDFGMNHSGQPYMVMEHLDGITLAQEIEAHGPLTLERFFKIFLQVCDGLSHAHSRNVLHRDIKPSNIMLVHTEPGIEYVKIMDFGLAKLL